MPYNINPQNENHGVLTGVIKIQDLILIFKRHTGIISGIMILALFLAVIMLVISTPQYTAEAVLQINVQKNKVVNIESVMSGITSDEGQVQSQLDILASRSLASRVVDNLHLIDDAEFSPSVKTSALKNLVLRLLKGADANLPDYKNNEEFNSVKSATISNVISKLNIARNPRSYTLVVKFTSKSPKKAALIANTFVDEYIKGQLAVKFDANRRANSWLTEKSRELQNKVRESEVLVQSFREKHGLIETSGLTVTQQQLSELNSQLILARTERAQAEARLSGVGEGDSSSDVLSSPLIQNLRNQEAEVLRKRSDLSSQYGPKHPKIINVNAELNDLRDKINIEINKVKASLENEVNIARARQEALQKNLDELQDKSGLSTKAKIELGELERQLYANKSLYESFLARSKETQEGQGFERPDAFIISDAEAPLVPSYPAKLSFICFALFIGAVVAICIVMLLEHLDNLINCSKQLEETTGYNAIGMVPELEKDVNIINYIIKKPSSLFAESLRSILAAIQFSSNNDVKKIIMIASSLPKEGKSSFALAFATMATNAGKKVLLIDADMKRPRIAKSLKKDFSAGLGELLEGSVDEEQVICKDNDVGFEFIPSHPNNVNSHKLLGSKNMQELLQKMRLKYDMVIIDTPPVMAISDCMVLSGMVDATIFVVRWQKSAREIVKSAIKQLLAFNFNVAGVVLTRVDIEKQSKYSYSDRGNYYKNYSEYYSS